MIRREGRHKKFVPKLEQVCYSAELGHERRQLTIFVTERAVFRVGNDGLELIEIAPGVEVERDVIAQMGFRPRIASDLRTMDARIFVPERMGLAEDIKAKPVGAIARPAWPSGTKHARRPEHDSGDIGPMNVNGSSRLYAIIGDPIAQVRSPQLYSECFAEAGLNAVMVPLHVPAEHFDASCPRCSASPISMGCW